MRYKVMRHPETGDVRVANDMTITGIKLQLEMRLGGYEEIATIASDIGLAAVKELVERSA